MRRRQAVAALLFLWQPLAVAAELPSLPSLAMRGLPAVVELSAHAIVAVLSVAASWALWIDRPGAGRIAIVAIAACVAAGVQTLFWTRLPTNTMPGDKLPLAALIVAVGAGCVLLLRNPPIR